jgi:hypothetical protein
MLHGKHLTQEGCEVVMLFLNIVLVYLKLDFRFPKRLSTFLTRMNFENTYYKGIKTFVSCTKCHSIYDIPCTNDEKKKQHVCSFIDSTTTCQNSLYQITKNGILNPFSVFVYNSIVSTLRTFFLRDGFVNSINSWKKRRLKGHIWPPLDLG